MDMPLNAPKIMLTINEGINSFYKNDTLFFLLYFFVKTI